MNKTYNTLFFHNIDISTSSKQDTGTLTKVKSQKSCLRAQVHIHPKYLGQFHHKCLGRRYVQFLIKALPGLCGP